MPQHAPFGPKGHGTAAATGFALGALSMAGLALALYGPAAGGPFGAYVALLRFTSLSTSAWLRTGLIRSALTVRPHRPCTRLTFCDALTASLTLRRLCSFCHQPQYSIYHSSCHELGGVRRGIMALSLLDRLVRTLQVHGTHTHASGALACQTADGVVQSPPLGWP
jgi:hypothetical protein